MEKWKKMEFGDKSYFSIVYELSFKNTWSIKSQSNCVGLSAFQQLVPEFKAHLGLFLIATLLLVSQVVSSLLKSPLKLKYSFLTWRSFRTPSSRGLTFAHTISLQLLRLAVRHWGRQARPGHMGTFSVCLCPCLQMPVSTVTPYTPLWSCSFSSNLCRSHLHTNLCLRTPGRSSSSGDFLSI